MGKIGTRIRRFKNGFTELPPGLPAEHYRFHVVGSYAFQFGLIGHFCLIILFLSISVISLALLNVGSTLAWVFIVWAHFKGRRTLSVSLAIIEVVIHAIVCVVAIGWGAGFQYFVLGMPMLIFFAHWFDFRLKFGLSLTMYLIYGGMYFYSGQAAPLIRLASWLENALYYYNASLFLFSLALTSYYYQKAAGQAESALAVEKEKSEELAELLKKMFGRYLSTEVMNSLIEDPSSLELGGERRAVTIMMTDLRGFTATCERLEPEQVVRMLNGYFEVMVEVIEKYGGTINEIIGDALLVIFGAPQQMPDRNERAVACAIEMQNAMARVNGQNRRLGLPELEMGIGLNETEVIVGNIGSAKRSKYAVVGSGVNMTSRIESYTVGGQVLVSESVHNRAGSMLRIDSQRDVFPKGSETPLRIYEVGGIAGSYNLALEARNHDPVAMSSRIPIRYGVLEGKDAHDKDQESFMVGLSQSGAEILCPEPVEALTNLKMNLGGVDQKLAARDFYGKVIKPTDRGQGKYLIRFTALPPEVDAYFQALRQHVVKPRDRSDPLNGPTPDGIMGS
jgi:class 3 adenylate cyclase